MPGAAGNEGPCILPGSGPSERERAIGTRSAGDTLAEPGGGGDGEAERCVNGESEHDGITEADATKVVESPVNARGMPAGTTGGEADALIADALEELAIETVGVGCGSGFGHGESVLPGRTVVKGKPGKVFHLQVTSRGPDPVR